jgi:hypothetical protein
MHSKRNPTKRYIELTTLSLLEKRSEWERFGQHLPEGGLFIVVSQDNPGAWRFLLRIARSFRETGRAVEIHYVPQGPTCGSDRRNCSSPAIPAHVGQERQ